MIPKLLLSAVIGLAPAIALAAGVGGSPTTPKADAVKTESTAKTDAPKADTKVAPAKTATLKTHKIMHHRAVHRASTTKPAVPPKPLSSKS